jgi:hypothetical protein
MTELTILQIDRARSSEYGNPAFYITFTDGSRARTKANAGWAYAIGNPGLREGCTVEVEYTARGTIKSMKAGRM